jgi:anti-anti-sigma factor
MEVRFDQDDRRAVLAMNGELDLATVPDLKAAIDQSVPWDAVDHLTVDLCDLDFMDSSGLSALIWLQKQHPDTEIGIRVSGDGMVKRLLEITAMPELFAVEIVPRSA